MRTERISRGPSTWRVLKAFEAARFSRASLHPISARTLSLSLYIYIYIHTNKQTPLRPRSERSVARRPRCERWARGLCTCTAPMSPLRSRNRLPPPPSPPLPPSLPITLAPFQSEVGTSGSSQRCWIYSSWTVCWPEKARLGRAPWARAGGRVGRRPL